MCYTIPIATSIVTTAIWYKKRESNLWSLNLMLYGAAIFGFIDHLWNGELFLISENIFNELCLGCVITVGVFLGWLVTCFVPKVSYRKTV